MDLKSLSSRQKKIVIILITSPNFLAVKDLAKKIGVSKRTIYRELSVLKEILKESGIDLKSKPGVGISIEGNSYLIEGLKERLENVTLGINLTPKEREIYIIQEFLFSGRFQKLTALAYKLSVTEATISYDLDRVAEWFEERGLFLVRKQGVGVYLKGSEAAFRRGIIDFFYDNVNEDEIFTLINNNLSNNMESKRIENSTIKTKILNFINLNISSRLEEAVDEILNQVQFNMVNSSYIGLIIHLSLAIKRLQSGEKIYINKDKLDKLKQTKEYKIAEKITDKLEDIFKLDIPVDERGYITMHLKGAKLRKELEIIDEPLDDEELEAIKLARMLISEVEEELKVDISNDFNLISGLAIHLEPALSRLRMGMEIRNPILEDLKNEYNEVFDATRRAVNKVAEVIDCKIPDSEVGFLTMHIAASLDNINKFDYQVRVLVVCSSGIGSSKILATRLKNVFKNIKIVDEVSAFSLKDNRIDERNIDLVISTIQIDNYQGEVVVVIPILLKDEVEKIQKKVKEIKLKNLENEVPNNRKSTDKLECRLETVTKLSRGIIKIIENFNMIKIERVKEYDQLIRRVCKEDFLPFEVDSKRVYNALKRREEKGATIIPEIKTSLLHARTDGVEEIFIGLVLLDEPILLPNLSRVKEEVDRVIVLLAPRELLKEEIKLISKFSASMIENKSFYKAIRDGREESFLKYLRRLIEDYYEDLIN